MGDIKVFRIAGSSAIELPARFAAVEKSLQTLIEKHLEALFGVKFIASEYSTGKTHGGRIDTLGIDENHCPVIIEYKRSVNENVISQGLYYLDWLLDRKAEFILQVLNHFGKEEADKVEWSNPRLLCVAGDFTKYDEFAVKQINRNIELIRYRRYADDLLLLELVNATTTQSGESDNSNHSLTSPQNYKTVTEQLEQSGQTLKDCFEELKAYLVALGDDIQVTFLKNYIAFKRIKNFVCVEISPKSSRLRLYLKVNPESCDLTDQRLRDVRKVGHWGTGDLEITIISSKDLDFAKPFLIQSYEQA